MCILIWNVLLPMHVCMYVCNNTHIYTNKHWFFVDNKWGQVTHNIEHIACFYRFLYILEKVLLLILLLL
jgi:hypothetical protein